jgi:WhiB family redox-sensing transcriptional regulator
VVWNFESEVPDLQDARCAQGDVDPEIFYSSSTQEAKAICQRCSVIRECREWSIRMRETYGVWGGLSSAERRLLLRGKRIDA